MKIHVSRVALAAVALTFVASLQAAGTWSVKAPMPTARYGLSAASMDGVVYAVGGTVGDCNDLPTVEAYDPSTDSWTPRAPMPTARSHLATAVLDGRLYAIGGTNFCGNHYSVVEAYDPATNTWQARASMPAPRVQIRAVVAAGKIHIVGGKSPGHVTQANTWAYDPTADAWSILPDAPTPRATYAAGGIGGEVYVFGGDEGQNRVESFDTASGTWSLRPEPFGPRSFFDAETIAGRVYIAGGYGGETRLDRFDGTSFAPLEPLPEGRAEHATAELGGILYVVGGWTGQIKRTMFAYRPDENAPPVADAGDDFTVIAGGQCTASPTLDGTRSTDPDGDSLGYSWSGAFGHASGPMPSVHLGLGTHVVTLVVDDAVGGSDSDEVVVSVVDASPPSVAAAASPNVLWPPNHEMVDVDISALAQDNCGSASCKVVSVASSEPDDGVSDGNTVGDTEITGTLTVRLRAERSGAGTGRIYTITLHCVDPAGNSTGTDVTVLAPRN